MTQTRQDSRPVVLIAGGGVAALEAALALRSVLSGLELDIEMLTPSKRFVYRPLSVLEPFSHVPTWTLALADFAADQDVRLVDGTLAEVDPERQVAIAPSGAERRYDRLLVATGARPERWLEGAMLFRDAYDAQTLAELIEDAAELPLADLVFALPPGASWSLPLYELALMSARKLRELGAPTRVAIVTPEARPLELFGAAASDALAERLAQCGVTVLLGERVGSIEDDVLELRDGRRLPADRVVVLPRVVGRPVRGLPRTGDGFLPVDAFCRVEGVRSVFAAGDVANFAVKQGGLSCQQADTAASAIMSELGAPVAPEPFHPVLRGVLLSGEDPTYLRALGGEGAAGEPPRASSPWWPPTKIAGRHLGPYLTLRAGAPRTPEVRADPGARATER
jgi:sulfide:quinone oxidoreductase